MGIERPTGIFSVLNTDPSSAQTINGAAYAHALSDQNEYAKAVADHLPGAVEHTAKLQDAETYRALVDVGTHNAFDAMGTNLADKKMTEYEWKSKAYDTGVTLASAGIGAVPITGEVAAPITEAFAAAAKTDILGPPPAHPNQVPYQDMASFDEYRTVLNGLLGNGVETGLRDDFIRYDDNHHPRVATYAEIQAAGIEMNSSKYNDVISGALSDIIGPDLSRISDVPRDTYNILIDDPQPWNHPAGPEPPGWPPSDGSR